MRVLALCMVLVFVMAPSARANYEVRSPEMVNQILMHGTFSTPDLEPGQSGALSFDVHNPYNRSMTGFSLKVGIYRYTEQEVSIAVDSSWRWEYPRLESTSTSGKEVLISYPSLTPGETRKVNLAVLTSTDMPHGGVFNQGAYLIRFWLDFNYNGSPASMASPGYWSKEQFMNATEEGDACKGIDCVGQVNLSRLGGIDGILPDTAFGVKDPVPMWPMYLLVVGAIFFAILAFLYYAEENPSEHPRSARAFAELKGRLARTFKRRGRARAPKT